MEKLTEKLRYVLEDCIDCISPIQQEVINKAVDRLAAYEENGDGAGGDHRAERQDGGA